MLVTIPRSVVVCSERVKNETKEAHLAAEKLLIPYLKDLQSIAAYARLLAAFYGFFAPLEEQIAPFITRTILPDVKQRRNANTILHDLEALGVTKRPECFTQLPSITNRLEAFGALYVLEGSTLGGPHIAHILQAKPALAGVPNAFGFFRVYGEATVGMWNRFQEALNEVAATETAITEVVQSATATFITFKQWMERQLK